MALVALLWCIPQGVCSDCSACRPGVVCRYSLAVGRYFVSVVGDSLSPSCFSVDAAPFVLGGPLSLSGFLGPLGGALPWERRVQVAFCLMGKR
jgi:hypothetical protein